MGIEDLDKIDKPGRLGLGNIMKVTELGLDNRIFAEMKQPNFSVEAITRKLNSEGIKITAQSVRKFVNKSKKAQQNIIATDLHAMEEYKKTTMDYIKTLKDILEEVDTIKNTVKDVKDYGTYNQLVGRIMQGIELMAKISGDIKPKSTVDINIIYNEITSDIEKKNRNLKNDFFKDNIIIDVEEEIKNDDKKSEERINKRSNNA